VDHFLALAPVGVLVVSGLLRAKSRLPKIVENVENANQSKESFGRGERACKVGASRSRPRKQSVIPKTYRLPERRRIVGSKLGPNLPGFRNPFQG
jgi:hypothetical protein